MKENPVLEKSFALRIIKLYKYLCEEKTEYVLSKAVLSSGTHIGKHVREALSGESRQVFVSEMAIALKNLRKPNIGSNCFTPETFSMKKRLFLSAAIVRN
jgi:hypothetical protein